MTQSTDPRARVDDFHLWSDKKPADLHRGQLLLWRTSHVRLGVKMVMTGEVRRMFNGWRDTYHLLPPMTRWDGYKHIIPADLEWSYAVPEWVSEQERTEMNGYKFVRLICVEGLTPKFCPFCGESPKWESRGGFIGSMPHQDPEFSLGCCVRFGHYQSPKFCAEKWDTRLPADDTLTSALDRAEKAEVENRRLREALIWLEAEIADNGRSNALDRPCRPQERTAR